MTPAERAKKHFYEPYPTDIFPDPTPEQLEKVENILPIDRLSAFVIRSQVRNAAAAIREACEAERRAAFQEWSDEGLIRHGHGCSAEFNEGQPDAMYRCRCGHDDLRAELAPKGGGDDS